MAGEALDVAMYTSIRCTSSASTCAHVGQTSNPGCSAGVSLFEQLLQTMPDQCLLTTQTFTDKKLSYR